MARYRFNVSASHQEDLVHDGEGVEVPLDTERAAEDWATRLVEGLRDRNLGQWLWGPDGPP